MADWVRGFRIDLREVLDNLFRASTDFLVDLRRGRVVDLVQALDKIDDFLLGFRTDFLAILRADFLTLLRTDFLATLRVPFLTLLREDFLTTLRVPFLTLLRELLRPFLTLLAPPNFLYIKGAPTGPPPWKYLQGKGVAPPPAIEPKSLYIKGAPVGTPPT